MSDVIPCPDCRRPLDGSTSCPHCHLPLTGPSAARLWAVDQRLAALDGEQHALRSERIGLLTAMRTGASPEATGSLAGRLLSGALPGGVLPGPSRPPRRRATPRLLPPHGRKPPQPACRTRC